MGRRRERPCQDPNIGQLGEVDLYYDVAAPVLCIRDGNVNVDNAADKPFWVNQTQLDDARRPIIAAMAFMGYGGTDDNSFAAFYASILSRAKDLALLPSDEPRRPYLCEALQKAAVSAIAGAAEQHLLMLVAPPYLAARPAAFVPEGSAAMVKLTQFDEDFRYTHDEIRRSARMGASSSSDVTSSRPAKPTHHAATSSVWDTDPSSKRQRRRRSPGIKMGKEPNRRESGGHNGALRSVTSFTLSSKRPPSTRYSATRRSTMRVAHLRTCLKAE